MFFKRKFIVILSAEVSNDSGFSFSHLPVNSFSLSGLGDKILN